MDRTVWECKTVSRDSAEGLANAVHEMGKDGWELVSVVIYKEIAGDKFVAFLKRSA